jgi:hypothetical protein
VPLRACEHRDCETAAGDPTGSSMYTHSPIGLRFTPHPSR